MPHNTTSQKNRILDMATIHMVSHTQQHTVSKLERACSKKSADKIPNGIFSGLFMLITAYLLRSLSKLNHITDKYSWKLELTMFSESHITNKTILSWQKSNAYFFKVTHHCCAVDQIYVFSSIRNTICKLIRQQVLAYYKASSGLLL
jgi:hypothetical protein